MKYVISNGKLVEEEKIYISPDDHSYRYGDGLFETMKVVNGNIFLKEYHFERLFAGLRILKFIVPLSFTEQQIEEDIKKICSKNDCEKLARVRLSVSRGNGGLYDCDNDPSYLVECWPLNEKKFDENGLEIDIFPDARKSIDKFSNLKSANYLPYVMAAIWAKENNLNDALILNSNERICDATIANVFWVKDGKFFTPPLTEGCVEGVMRRKIMEGHETFQDALTQEILLNADEVFLTNVTSGIRWVGQFRNKRYTNKIARKIFAEIIQTISV